jgi:carboxylesterase type B
MYGAAHAFELPFVFGRVDGQIYPEDGLEARQQLSSRVMSWWSCMAGSGDPNCATDAPAWPRFVQDGEAPMRRMVLDGTLSTDSLPSIDVQRIDYWLDYYASPLPRIPAQTVR